MARKRRGKPGDFTQLRAVLWKTILEVEALLDTRPPSNDVVLRSAHALAQLGASYRALVEASDMSQRLSAVEAGLARQEALRATNGAHRSEV